MRCDVARECGPNNEMFAVLESSDDENATKSMERPEVLVESDHLAEKCSLLLNPVIVRMVLTRENGKRHWRE